MQTEQRREDEKEQSVAQHANGTLCARREQRRPQIVNILDLEGKTEPGEIVIHEPCQGNSPENDQAYQRGGEEIQCARYAHHVDLKPLLKTIKQNSCRPRRVTSTVTPSPASATSSTFGRMVKELALTAS